MPLLFFYYLLKYQFFISFFLHFKKKNKLSLISLRFILKIQSSFLYISNILMYKDNLHLQLINNQSYLTNFFSVINNTLILFTNDHYHQILLKEKNSYFFWYYFNQDYLINFLINLCMKHGKKNISYKNIYKSFFFLKKLSGLNPIFFLKKLLYRNRFLFEVSTLTLRKVVRVKPRLLSIKSQLLKSIRIILNNFSFNKFKFKNKTTIFYKKIIYLLLHSLFNKDKLINLIRKETLMVKHNFNHIKKEIFFNRYVFKYRNIIKSSYFNVKHVSLTKKMKVLNTRSRLIKNMRNMVDIPKLLLLDRYKLNIQSKLRIKQKWINI